MGLKWVSLVTVFQVTKPIFDNWKKYSYNYVRNIVTTVWLLYVFNFLIVQNNNLLLIRVSCMWHTFYQISRLRYYVLYEFIVKVFDN